MNVNHFDAVARQMAEILTQTNFLAGSQIKVVEDDPVWHAALGFGETHNPTLIFVCFLPTPPIGLRNAGGPPQDMSDLAKTTILAWRARMMEQARWNPTPHNTSAWRMIQDMIETPNGLQYRGVLLKFLRINDPRAILDGLRRPRNFAVAAQLGCISTKDVLVLGV
ncbi:uncharacterized protein BDV14DRAFT_196705 [Aspergillus stella-maris]|uniref:uncharacterized protein n=1 Tax=Aspergillus stella-maris TaxID=1810926 RepID=UPI003CCE0744